MDMCPLHNNYIGENTTCPACAAVESEPRPMTEEESSIMIILNIRTKELHALRNQHAHLKITCTMLRWAAVTGWACTILLLAFGDKL